jgi:hypothetical protein
MMKGRIFLQNAWKAVLRWARPILWMALAASILALGSVGLGILWCTYTIKKCMTPKKEKETG